MIFRHFHLFTRSSCSSCGYMPAGPSANSGTRKRWRFFRRRSLGRGWRRSWRMDRLGIVLCVRKILFLSVVWKHSLVSESPTNAISRTTTTYHCKAPSELPVHLSPDRISQCRAEEPSESSEASGGQTHDDHRVQAHDLCPQRVQILRSQKSNSKCCAAH